MTPLRQRLIDDLKGLTWYKKKGSDQPEWFNENPGDDYEEITHMCTGLEKIMGG